MWIDAGASGTDSGEEGGGAAGPCHPLPALCPDFEKVSSLVLHCPEIRPSEMLSCPPFPPASASFEQLLRTAILRGRVENKRVWVPGNLRVVCPGRSE